MQNKPSLLLISHTYAIDEHAKKLPMLARHFNLTCVTVTKESWGKHFGIDVEKARQETEKATYTTIELNAVGNVNSVTGFILNGLHNVISSYQWDIVLVENEPWSLLKWQTFFCTRIFCSKAMYGEFTWENLIRPGLKGIILSMVYKLTSRWADFWICGNAAAAKIVTEYGTPKNAVLVSPQVGVDHQHYRPASNDEKVGLKTGHGLPSQAFVIGYAGRLVEEKGISDLLNAVEQINQSTTFKAQPIHLALMGHGPMKEALEGEARNKSWMKIYDPVPHHKLPTFLQCLDILVLGSRRVMNRQTCWEEQFGHILIEAIGCGSLVLGSRSGAIPEVIGDNDLLFTPNNINELASQLLHYALRRDLLNLKRSKLRDRLEEKYTHEAIATEWSGFLLKRLHASH